MYMCNLITVKYDLKNAFQILFCKKRPIVPFVSVHRLMFDIFAVEIVFTLSSACSEVFSMELVSEIWEVHRSHIIKYPTIHEKVQVVSALICIQCPSV